MLLFHGPASLMILFHVISLNLYSLFLWFFPINHERTIVQLAKKKKEEEINLDPYHTTYEVKPKMCPRPKSKAWNSKTHNLKENIPNKIIATLSYTIIS